MNTIERLTALFLLGLLLLVGAGGIVVWFATGTWWNGMMGVIGIAMASLMYKDLLKEAQK